MSNYDEIFYTETDQDADYDYAAIQEAEAILNGTIPSTPETYAMVQKFYGKADGLEQHTTETQTRVQRKRDHVLRDVRSPRLPIIRSSAKETLHQGRR